MRLGSALNLNIHFHMLFLEDAISENPFGWKNNEVPDKG
jgi:hypothetical protein